MQELFQLRTARGWMDTIQERVLTIVFSLIQYTHYNFHLIIARKRTYYLDNASDGSDVYVDSGDEYLPGKDAYDSSDSSGGYRTLAKRKKTSDQQQQCSMETRSGKFLHAERNTNDFVKLIPY